MGLISFIIFIFSSYYIERGCVTLDKRADCGIVRILWNELLGEIYSRIIHKSTVNVD